MALGIIYDDVTDSAGNAIANIDVTIYIAGTVTKASLFDASEGGSPLSNPVQTNDKGVFSAYVAAGDYDVSVDAPGGTVVRPNVTVADGDDIADLLSVRELGAITSADKVTYDGESATVDVALDARVPTVATLAALQAVSTTGLVGDSSKRDMDGRTSAGDGGEGRFVWRSGDQSANVAADEVGSGLGNGGIWIAPSSDLTGASGAWERETGGAISALWYTGTAATDYLAGLTAVISYAATIAGRDKNIVPIQCHGHAMDITGTVDLSNAPFVVLVQPKFKATGGAWVATDPIVKGVTATSDGLEAIGISGFYLDCNHLCAGPQFKNTLNAFAAIGRVVHAQNWHFDLNTKNTEFVASSVTVNQFYFGETGYDSIANRTADGFLIGSNDVRLVSCTGYYCLYPLHHTAGQFQATGCHFYNGSTVDGSDNVGIYLENSSGAIIDGVYIDNGIILIKGDSSGSSTTFNHKISGIGLYTATGNVTKAIKLDAVQANETAEGLAIDMTIRGLAAGNGVELITDGGGTWSTPLSAAVNIMDRDGARLSMGRMVAPDGSASSPGLIFSSEADQNTGFYRPGADQIAYAANGAGQMVFGENLMEPVTANVLNLGSSSKHLFASFFNQMKIVDGVTAPSTIAGFASIYIDTADGDLKIKFGDGTVKTIVTDV